MTDGKPTPIVRRLAHDTDGTAVAAYQRLELRRSMADTHPRVTDVFSIIDGISVAGELVARIHAHLVLGPADASAAFTRGKAVNTLSTQGKAEDALRAFEQLPLSYRRTEEGEIQRVWLARAASQDEYRIALNQLDIDYGDDPSIAMIEIDGDIFRKEYATAIRHIDQLEEAVGHDAYVDHMHASAYYLAGDYETADSYSNLATDAEPGLEDPWWMRLAVEVARKQWTACLGTMDHLSAAFGAAFDDAKLRATPAYAALVATPEYAAWQANRAK
jgi:tetratricopeptide (TPR) repeat protein